MIITCGQCRTKFRVSSGLIKETGSRVRCSNCQAVFTVFRPLPGEEFEDAPRAESSPRPSTGGGGAATVRDQAAEALDRELEGLFDDERDQGEIDSNPSLRPPERPILPPIVAARPAYPADNNPINLIKPNGDSFVVDAERLPPRPAPPPNPSPRNEGFDLGLGEEPSLMGGPRSEPENDRSEDQSLLDVPPDSPESAKPAPLRTASSTFTPGQKKLLLALSVIAALLAAGVLLMFLRPGDPAMVALQDVSRPPSGPISEGGPDGLAAEPDDSPSDALNLIFSKEQLSHHYFDNSGAGQILVITGRIVNGYNERIGQIRVKGVLKNDAGTIVAERQVFAGNYLTEEELKTLPMKEILARLALRGGQNGVNLDIPPEKAVPFMLVFDRLPTDLAEYLVEPVGYVPSSDALSSLQGAARDRTSAGEL